MSRFAAWCGAILCVAALSSAFLARPAAGAEMTLEELIQAVRENELLYANIDVTLHDSFRDRSEHSPGKITSFDGKFHGSPLVSEERSARFVAQEKYFRYEEETNSETTEGEQYTIVHRSAYDGDTTRLRTGGIANLAKGYKPAGLPIRPHNLLLRMVGRCERLSSFLEGDAAIARDEYGYMEYDAERFTEYVGPDRFQGLRCQVVRSFGRDRKSGQLYNHADVWLAEDRNLIPARYVGYEYRVSQSEPVGEGVVIEWKEIQPGIWFPMHAECKCIDQRIAILKGVRSTGWRREYVIESVSLMPKYERSFFQDVPIPPGTIVYEIEGDRITRSYQLGSPSSSVRPPKHTLTTFWRRLVAGGAFLLVGCICIVLMSRRYRRRSLQKNMQRIEAGGWS